MEVSRLPPKANMGTLIPVFPKGRVGIVCGRPSEASAEGLHAVKIDPKLAAPRAFKKFLRDLLCFFTIIRDPMSLNPVLIFGLLR